MRHQLRRPPRARRRQSAPGRRPRPQRLAGKKGHHQHPAAARIAKGPPTEKEGHLDPGQTEKMMKLQLYTNAMLRCDEPQHRLRRGDIVKLVDHHVAPDGTEGYSIEVFNAVGDTIAVTAVASSALEALRED